MKHKILYLLVFALHISVVVAQDNRVSETKDTIANRSRNISVVTNEVIDLVFKPDNQLKADSIIKDFDDSPAFEIYKDNYVIIGTNISQEPTKDNSDAKFQISFRQRLTNSVLPFRTYLFISYTQVAFWDVFHESFPFRDINFNPTIGVGRPLVRDNRYLGELSFQLEHESNGKDGDLSRSWNKVSVSGLFKLTSHWTYFAKAWIPIVDGKNNRNITHYKGLGMSAINYNKSDKYNISLIATKRAGGHFSSNIALHFAYKFRNENQYLFLEFYNGYGESLLDYNKFTRRLRLGFVIKPNFRFIY